MRTKSPRRRLVFEWVEPRRLMTATPNSVSFGDDTLQIELIDIGQIGTPALQASATLAPQQDTASANFDNDITTWQFQDEIDYVSLHTNGQLQPDNIIPNAAFVQFAISNSTNPYQSVIHGDNYVNVDVKSATDFSFNSSDNAISKANAFAASVRPVENLLPYFALREYSNDALTNTPMPTELPLIGDVTIASLVTDVAVPVSELVGITSSVPSTIVSKLQFESLASKQPQLLLGTPQLQLHDSTVEYAPEINAPTLVMHTANSRQGIEFGGPRITSTVPLLLTHLSNEFKVHGVKIADTTAAVPEATYNPTLPISLKPSQSAKPTSSLRSLVEMYESLEQPSKQALPKVRAQRTVLGTPSTAASNDNRVGEPKRNPEITTNSSEPAILLVEPVTMLDGHKFAKNVSAFLNDAVSTTMSLLPGNRSQARTYEWDDTEAESIEFEVESTEFGEASRESRIAPAADEFIDIGLVAEQDGAATCYAGGVSHGFVISMPQARSERLTSSERGSTNTEFGTYRSARRFEARDVESKSTVEHPATTSAQGSPLGVSTLPDGHSLDVGEIVREHSAGLEFSIVKVASVQQNDEPLNSQFSVSTCGNDEDEILPMTHAFNAIAVHSDSRQSVTESAPWASGIVVLCGLAFYQSRRLQDTYLHDQVRRGSLSDFC